ncbi:GAF domain-containing protein [Niastella populi]|uniref:Serine/threonine protein phosphatase n=1 Tax=Niastella populi TaxID=550983 RepID=A0A1V9ENV5_9BACT|nr:GAF domain-containing protein [Niastella populi]OQP47828.1 serine/threonine protein phosphatase [Niastella populi]
MTTLQKPANEEKRIEELKRYNILDTPPDGSFDRITRLAAILFDVPIAIISLVDTDRIWFKSAYGLSVNQINRDPGLCASAILSDDVYVIDNAATDPRTLANPLVAGEFGLRFYAAAPLQTERQCNLGTLCIIDKTPRILTEKEQKILKELSEIVMDEMELRLALRNTVINVKKLTLDIRDHLDDAIQEVEKTGDAKQKEKMLDYLDASKTFLNHVEQQLSLM